MADSELKHPCRNKAGNSMKQLRFAVALFCLLGYMVPGVITQGLVYKSSVANSYNQPYCNYKKFLKNNDFVMYFCKY